MSEEPLDIEQQLRRSLRYLTLSVVILAFVTVVVTGFATAYAFYDREKLRKEEERTTKALCSFRDDLYQRLETNKAFVDRTKGEIKKAIELSIESQQHAFNSLVALHCEGD